MPKYKTADYNVFLTKVNAANPKFTLKRSSLKGLIGVLTDDGCTAQKVIAEIGKIKQDRKIKYWDALLHLRMTMQGVGQLKLPGGGAALGKRNAVFMNKVDVLPSCYNYDWKDKNLEGMYRGEHKFKMIEPETHFLGMTVEQYIWEHDDNIGIVLIHLGKVLDEMDMVMGGMKCTDHINSVLNIAAKKNLKLCALHLFKDTPINASFAEAFQKVGQRVTVFEPNKHEGGDIKEFKDFINEHETCVVMGWDADVCVAANVLGGSTLDKTGDEHKFITPILGISNVVTARPLILTNGVINTQQWGVLWGT